jgi:CRISPR/Cas system-associated endoribonuclease Cas2
MKRQLFFICFISFVQLTMAQNYIHEFGKYTNEEFQLQKYSKDPSAEAVVIYDIGKSYFNSTDEGFELIFERRTKIKIFTKAGLKWAQISIPYYEENNKNEEIIELKGNTFNFENGEIRISPLDIKNSYNEKYNEHWHNRKFAMPDVKEGSVIEISYQISSPYLFNLRNWEFQNKIPVIYSEYTTKMIPFYEYTYILQGASKFDDFKSFVEKGLPNRFAQIDFQNMVYYFVMKDIPAFKDESFITSTDDYIIKLDFQLAAIHYPTGGDVTIMTTWKKMSEEMLDNDNFGKYLKNSKKKGKEIIDTMKIASLSTYEKARIIEHFVKSNFNWNGNNDKFSNKSVKDFLVTKTGNCAEINLFLTGMLNAAGVEAYPVIISTRSHGKIKLDYPFHHFFNYVIVVAKIDSSSILLDATEPLSNFSEIPTRCLNDKGFVIQKNKIEWVDLKSTSISSIEYKFVLKPDTTNNTISESCRLITTGYNAIDYRNKFSSSYKELKINLLGNSSLLGDSLKPINLVQIEKPFEVDFNKKDQIETIEDKIIISPFCKTVITENPLKQAFRNYLVDFTYKKAFKFQSNIVVPRGYKLFKKPENLNINNNMIRITYNTENEDSDTIKVMGVYEFKKDIYVISEYFDLKSYFNKIVDKFNEQLVFVKEL